MKGKLFVTAPFALLFAFWSTSALAGDITGVTVTPSSGTVVQGGSLSYTNTPPNGFTAEITSASGKFGAVNAPDVGYCSDWIIDSNGAITCDQSSTLNLTPGLNYTTASPSPLPIKGNVTVNTYGDTPCGRTYTINEVFTAPNGSGTDFGTNIMSVTVPFYVTVSCPATNNAGGCSPGFWRNNTSKWPAGVLTTTLVSAVFSEYGSTSPNDYSSLGNETLLQALQNPGGGSSLDAKANILLFQAVAAYLNSSIPTIYYPLATSQVQTDVNDALASPGTSSDGYTALTTLGTTLDGYNNLGGPYCSDAGD